MDSSLKTATTEELCSRLAEGQSLVAVCAADDMPSVRSVQTWMADDPAFAAQVTRAREAGYLIRGERAVEAAKVAKDAATGRLAFDAERWYLGKLSNAFSDTQKVHHGGEITVKKSAADMTDDELAAIAAGGA